MTTEYYIHRLSSRKACYTFDCADELQLERDLAIVNSNNVASGRELAAGGIEIDASHCNLTLEDVKALCRSTRFNQAEVGIAAAMVNGRVQEEIGKVTQSSASQELHHPCPQRLPVRVLNLSGNEELLKNIVTLTQFFIFNVLEGNDTLQRISLFSAEQVEREIACSRAEEEEGADDQAPVAAESTCPQEKKNPQWNHAHNSAAESKKSSLDAVSKNALEELDLFISFNRVCPPFLKMWLYRHHVRMLRLRSQDKEVSETEKEDVRLDLDEHRAYHFYNDACVRLLVRETFMRFDQKFHFFRLKSLCLRNNRDITIETVRLLIPWILSKEKGGDALTELDLSCTSIGDAGVWEIAQDLLMCGQHDDHCDGNSPAVVTGTHNIKVLRLMDVGEPLSDATVFYLAKGLDAEGSSATLCRKGTGQDDHPPAVVAGGDDDDHHGGAAALPQTIATATTHVSSSSSATIIEVLDVRLNSISQAGTEALVRVFRILDCFHILEIEEGNILTEDSKSEMVGKYALLDQPFALRSTLASLVRQGPNCTITTLDFGKRRALGSSECSSSGGGYSLTDASVLLLIHALEKNTSLRSLTVSHNTSITLEGFVAICEWAAMRRRHSLQHCRTEHLGLAGLSLTQMGKEKITMSEGLKENSGSAGGGAAHRSSMVDAFEILLQCFSSSVCTPPSPSEVAANPSSTTITTTERGEVDDGKEAVVEQQQPSSDHHHVPLGQVLKSLDISYNTLFLHLQYLVQELTRQQLQLQQQQQIQSSPMDVAQTSTDDAEKNGNHRYVGIHEVDNERLLRSLLHYAPALESLNLEGTEFTDRCAKRADFIIRSRQCGEAVQRVIEGLLGLPWLDTRTRRTKTNGQLGSDVESAVVSGEERPPAAAVVEELHPSTQNDFALVGHQFGDVALTLVAEVIRHCSTQIREEGRSSHAISGGGSNAPVNGRAGDHQHQGGMMNKRQTTDDIHHMMTTSTTTASTTTTKTKVAGCMLYAPLPCTCILLQNISSNNLGVLELCETIVGHHEYVFPHVTSVIVKDNHSLSDDGYEGFLGIARSMKNLHEMTLDKCDVPSPRRGGWAGTTDAGNDEDESRGLLPPRPPQEGASGGGFRRKKVVDVGTSTTTEEKAGEHHHVPDGSREMEEEEQEQEKLPPLPNAAVVEREEVAEKLQVRIRDTMEYNNGSVTFRHAVDLLTRSNDNHDDGSSDVRRSRKNEGDNNKAQGKSVSSVVVAHPLLLLPVFPSREEKRLFVKNKKHLLPSCDLSQVTDDEKGMVDDFVVRNAVVKHWPFITLLSSSTIGKPHPLERMMKFSLLDTLRLSNNLVTVEGFSDLLAFLAFGTQKNLSSSKRCSTPQVEASTETATSPSPLCRTVFHLRVLDLGNNLIEENARHHLEIRDALAELVLRSGGPAGCGGGTESPTPPPPLCSCGRDDGGGGCQGRGEGKRSTHRSCRDCSGHQFPYLDTIKCGYNHFQSETVMAVAEANIQSKRTPSSLRIVAFSATGEQEDSSSAMGSGADLATDSRMESSLAFLRKSLALNQCEELKQTLHQIRSAAAKSSENIRTMELSVCGANPAAVQATLEVLGRDLEDYGKRVNFSMIRFQRCELRDHQLIPLMVPFLPYIARLDLRDNFLTSEGITFLAAELKKVALSSSSSSRKCQEPHNELSPSITSIRLDGNVEVGGMETCTSLLSFIASCESITELGLVGTRFPVEDSIRLRQAVQMNNQPMLRDMLPRLLGSDESIRTVKLSEPCDDSTLTALAEALKRSPFIEELDFGLAGIAGKQEDKDKDPGDVVSDTIAATNDTASISGEFGAEAWDVFCVAVGESVALEKLYLYKCNLNAGHLLTLLHRALSTGNCPLREIHFGDKRTGHPQLSLAATLVNDNTEEGSTDSGDGGGSGGVLGSATSSDDEATIPNSHSSSSPRTSLRSITLCDVFCKILDEYNNTLRLVTFLRGEEGRSADGGDADPEADLIARVQLAAKRNQGHSLQVKQSLIQLRNKVLASLRHLYLSSTRGDLRRKEDFNPSSEIGMRHVTMNVKWKGQDVDDSAVEMLCDVLDDILEMCRRRAHFLVTPHHVPQPPKKKKDDDDDDTLSSSSAPIVKNNKIDGDSSVAFSASSLLATLAVPSIDLSHNKRLTDASMTRLCTTLGNLSNYSVSCVEAARTSTPSVTSAAAAVAASPNAMPSLETTPMYTSFILDHVGQRGSVPFTSCLMQTLSGAPYLLVSFEGSKLVLDIESDAVNAAEAMFYSECNTEPLRFRDMLLHFKESPPAGSRFAYFPSEAELQEEERNRQQQQASVVAGTTEVVEIRQRKRQVYLDDHSCELFVDRLSGTLAGKSLHLSKILLPDNDIGTPGAELLLRALIRHEHCRGIMTALDLSGNKLDNDILDALCDFISATSTTLVDLNISRNEKLTSLIEAPLLRTIQEAPPQCSRTTLRTLDVYNSNPLMKLSSFQKLKIAAMLSTRGTDVLHIGWGFLTSPSDPRIFRKVHRGFETAWADGKSPHRRRSKAIARDDGTQPDESKPHQVAGRYIKDESEDEDEDEEEEDPSRGTLFTLKDRVVAVSTVPLLLTLGSLCNVSQIVRRIDFQSLDLTDESPTGNSQFEGLYPELETSQRGNHAASNELEMVEFQYVFTNFILGCQNLEEIDLSHNKLTMNGCLLPILISAVRLSRTIKHIDFSYNHPDESGPVSLDAVCTQLEGLFAKNTTLKMLLLGPFSPGNSPLANMLPNTMDLPHREYLKVVK